MDSPPSENQPCPLQFYNFSQLDHKQHCPVYSSIVEHNTQEIAVDDINSLESEFVALQHSVQNRIDLLESELVVLDNWQVKREYTRKPSFTQPPVRKIARVDADKPKKPKHSKHQPTIPSSLDTKVEKEPGKQDSALLHVKGDAPDRFWASVEPYCADITEADIRMLQDGIRSYEKKEELFRVPPLGQHYSRHWATEDVEEEQSESFRLGQMADPLTLWEKAAETQAKDSFDSFLKDGESLQPKKTSSQYGPLTERLIAAFLEDPVAGSGGKTRSQGHKMSVPSSDSLTDTLEDRIKKELTSLGLLEPLEAKEEESGQGDGDEILAELKKKQAELSSIMEFNREQREVLLSLAKVEMRKQEAYAKVKEVDDEIVEWLKKVNAWKQKRKSLGRKERESIWKLLETRDSLLQKME